MRPAVEVIQRYCWSASGGKRTSPVVSSSLEPEPELDPAVEGGKCFLSKFSRVRGSTPFNFFCRPPPSETLPVIKRVPSVYLINDNLIFEEQKRRHRADVVLLGYRSLVVYIHFGKRYVSVGF